MPVTIVDASYSPDAAAGPNGAASSKQTSAATRAMRIVEAYHYGGLVQLRRGGQGDGHSFIETSACTASRLFC
jgi:hypothetical protein